MKEIRLGDGFECKIDETKFDDMRFVDLLAMTIDTDLPDGTKVVGFSKLIHYILGPEQKKLLYECVAKEHNGHVPVAAMQEVLGAIMSQVKSVPN